MNTKTISLLLVLSMCLLMFAGCQSTKLHSLSEDAAANGEGEPSDTPAPEATTGPKDYSAAYKAYPVDQVMLTVDGIDITWGELFYWYAYDVSNMENYFGTITDWDAVSSFDSTKTNREYVTENAIATISRYCSLEKKAADIGVSLNEIDNTMLQAQWENNVANYGGSEEALLAYLEAAYLSKAVYDHISRVNVLYTKVSEEMFGANGEKISDKDLYPVAEDMGYMRAKHILISTVDDTNTELPEQQLTEKKARADEIYAQLSAITDHSALELKVDEYIKSDSEDPGSAYYTEGYTFLAGSGTMDADFEAAVSSLGEYEISKPVKTQFGYHIILRLPLDRQAPVSYTSETEFTTLGYYVAQEMFSAETESWAQKTEVVTTKEYDSIDLAAVFELANKAAEEAAAAAAAEAEASAEPGTEPNK